MKSARSASLKCLKRNLVVSSAVKTAIDIGTSPICGCSHLQVEGHPTTGLSSKVKMSVARHPAFCTHIRASSSGKSSTGSEAFFRVDTFRVRRRGSRQLSINTEAAPGLLSTVFCLAMPPANPSLAVSIGKKLHFLFVESRMESPRHRYA